ncbi:ATP-binding protein [Candidatus Woesearchaeota archaeon]|nr:MAG: ATP-binding protein [Candidatus Woesearchaeota archaeon]
MKGQIISGDFGNIIVRQKAGREIELGELLVSEDGRMLFEVVDLRFGSQISEQNRELISGMDLEENADTELFEKELRNYTIAVLKPVIRIGEKASLVKTLPVFLSKVREVKEEDLKFLTKPKNPLFLGKLRSGSKVMNVDIFLDAAKALSHHILIPATTGRGKSNLTMVMLWGQLDKDYCGVLVLDPHDEYFGRHKLGLKDHPKSENLVYYTMRSPPPGQRTLKINVEQIKPNHFNGVVEWSQAQHEALAAYHKKYKEKWVEAIIKERPVDNFNEATLSVIKRRMLSLLDLELDSSGVYCKGIFDFSAGETTIRDIVNELIKGKTVVIDTSYLSGAVEILVGSLITTEVFSKYKHFKATGELKDKPVISIVLEEAPRVLGKEVLEKGSNIFSTIAREGRKFKVGLTAITQLPSLIPRQILANMNTKIILGLEMAPERNAIIESASQDLTEASKSIASLDIGEAIISSNFVKFATPIKIPLFEEMAKSAKDKKLEENSFEGVKLGG